MTTMLHGTGDRVPDGWWVQTFDELYPRLYKHRDLGEAERFVDALQERFSLSGQRILDLGCGGGRHLRVMLQRGWGPIGCDLSGPLLQSARADLPTSDLIRADMRRLPLRGKTFHWILMMFTTFGYFSDEAENHRVLEEVSQCLADRGRLVLDLVNSDRLRTSLVPQSDREVDGRRVEERRWIDESGPFVCKETQIEGRDEEDRQVYLERVRLYEREELEGILAGFHLTAEDCFGDYDGTPYQRGTSPRMILIAQQGAGRR